MKEHYVVIGANPLAVNIYKGLKNAVCRWW